MLCSRCSENVRPVVAIDIDGTLADYHSHFLDFAWMWIGRSHGDFPPYDGDEPFRDWFCRTHGVDVTTFRAIKLAYRQGGMKRTQPLIFGAKQLVETLHQQAEVWLTTTRPHDRFDRVDPDTREWLKRNGIKFHGLLYSGDKMSELAEMVDRQRVVAVLDDQEDVLMDAASLGLGQPIKAETKYNKAWHWNNWTAKSLTEAYNMINVLVEGWTRSNG